MSRSQRVVIAVGCVALVLLAGCAAGPLGTPSGNGAAPNVDPGSPTPTGAVEGTLDVHFINVGQSVSTLIIAPSGETMLIDTGHYRDDGEYVLQYLQQRGVDRIDYLVSSHNDADHIGGHAALITHYETQGDGIGAVYDPGIAASTETYGEYLDAIERQDVTLYEVREGDRIPFEGVGVQVMGPPDPYIEDEARNENSVVLRVAFGETSFLFTGDAEDDQEAYLRNQYSSQLQATVLKAGHHGSDSSTSGPLLDAVGPRAVVISSGHDNQYGHPDPATLDRLAARDIPTYWTATHGHVVLTSDGQTVTVATQQEAPTSPDSLRDGSPIPVGSTDSVQPRSAITSSGTSETTPAGTATPTVATDGGTPTPDESLGVATIHADAEGDDQANLNDEYIVFENTGDDDLELSGWTIADDAGHTYTVPDGFVLEAGATVTLHTGSGTDTATDLYWDAGTPVWNNGGDTVIVKTEAGETVLTEQYE